MGKRFDPKALSLSWYSPKDILKISVCEVTSPISFDMFGHQVPDGLYDLRMGPLQRDQACQTCRLSDLHCPGHFGHARLSRPVLNPLLYDSLFALLRSMCFSCHSFKITNFERMANYTRLRALRRGIVLGDVEEFIRDRSVDEIEEAINAAEGEEGSKSQIHCNWVAEFFRRYSTKAKCPRCNARSPKLTRGTNMRVLVQGRPDAPEAEDDDQQPGVSYLNPEEIRRLITQLYANESALLEEFFRGGGCDMFFIDLLPVIPNKFRPARYMDGKVFENSVNTQIARIIQFSLGVEADIKFWPDLQAFVLFYFDSTHAQNITAGCKQILEKKEGLFRKNIMGKRVNYAARSVISPDPNLRTREIGVPLVFARQLTFPERVTAFNAERLRVMVMNGASYPGCNYVQCGSALTDMAYISDEARFAIARQLTDGSKVVWRHMLDGDVVLVNRQPTLHSVGLMAHTVRVLRNEKTLRMHYVNCKPYNADFDGDEMNIHFPQSYQALAECRGLVHNDHNYFVAATGKPIRGLEQDHVVAAAVLTMKDTLLTYEEYCTLVQTSIDRRAPNRRRRLFVAKPCIEAPVRLFSGKQVITTVMKNLSVDINYEAVTKLVYKIKSNTDEIGKHSRHFQHDQESLLIVRNGMLLTGALDKNTVGAVSFSLVHACGEIYGYAFCNDLLTDISRTVNAFLAMRGFSVRFDDILMDAAADEARQAIFTEGHARAAAFQREQCASSREDFYLDPDRVAALDGEMRGLMNACTSQVVDLLNEGLFKKFPENNMANIILTGAKGSMVNLSQISCSLGQQELEGRRVPFMSSGKTLPCFRRLEAAPSAGGYVFERFLTGINPATFFFHCMAGREGLIDTAVKTANSGYLQRCLMKHLEGVKIEHDGTVRVANKILQYRYGDDGIDCVRETYLHKADFYEQNRHLFRGSSNGTGQEAFMEDRRARSMAEPGTAVGVIAAQSVGEPSTQMTLNTFHLAGVGGQNVTLGIPRLREIIMVASKTIKTPVITAPIRANRDALEDVFRKIVVADCLESVSVQELVVRKAGQYAKSIKIVFDIREHQELCARVLDSEFLKALGKDIKKRSSSVGITEYAGKGKEDKAAEEDRSESSSDEVSSEEELDDLEKDAVATDGIEGEAEVEGFLEDLDEEQEAAEESDDGVPLMNLKKISARRYSFEIFYPVDFNVLLLPIIEGISKKMIVRQMKGFQKATVSGSTLQMAGSDFASIFGMSMGIDLAESLDLCASYSNDIYAVYRYFGLEAARSVIVQEIINVFDVYGIKINIRHLYLIADYMLKDGHFSPYSRASFTMDDSFIQKMSFESCFTNLKNSAIFHQREVIAGPSACLTVGSSIKQGTGSCSILYNLNAYDE